MAAVRGPAAERSGGAAAEPRGAGRSAALGAAPPRVRHSARAGGASSSDYTSTSSSASSTSGSRSPSPPSVVTRGPPLVRAVVGDYIEGQGDPEVREHTIRRTSTQVAADEPMRLENRGRYVWVARMAAGTYTHDTERASASDYRRAHASHRRPRCAVCGSQCKRAVYRLRCYARRGPEDPPEVEVPRVMMPQVYFTGRRCMRGLLGIPPVQTRRVTELRRRLPVALGERAFAPRGWAEPLRRLAPREGDAYRAMLHSELARIIAACARPGAAWRRLAHARRGEGGANRDVAVRTRATAMRGLESRPYEEEECGEEPPARADAGAEARRSERPGEARQVAPAERADAMAETSAADAFPAPPHELYRDRGPRPPYVLVVPSYGRPERLQTNTLAFLKAQGIPQERIEVWLAPGRAPGQELEELERYKRALRRDWPRLRLRVGVRGIMEQRWHIARRLPEGTHVVSLDDDVPEVFFKARSGTATDTLVPLPKGALDCLIHHAWDIMHQEGAYIWGLAPSSNPLNLVTWAISRKNGMVNGFAYGYRVRHDDDLRSVYGSPTEDVERSCRTFAKDGIVLRYQMYCARTIFKAPDGINLLYASPEERKAAEEQAIEDIAAEFPGLVEVRRGADRRKTEAAMNFRFRPIGMLPLISDGRAKSEVPELARCLAADGAGAASEPQLARRAAVEKALLGRCAALQDFLGSEAAARRAEVEARHGAAAAAGGGGGGGGPEAGAAPEGPPGEAVPEVLDDVVRLATEGRRSLRDLGIPSRRSTLGKVGRTPPDTAPADAEGRDFACLGGEASWLEAALFGEGVDAGSLELEVFGCPLDGEGGERSPSTPLSPVAAPAVHPVPSEEVWAAASPPMAAPAVHLVPSDEVWAAASPPMAAPAVHPMPSVEGWAAAGPVEVEGLLQPQPPLPQPPEASCRVRLPTVSIAVGTSDELDAHCVQASSFGAAAEAAGFETPLPHSQPLASACHARLPTVSVDAGAIHADYGLRAPAVDRASEGDVAVSVVALSGFRAAALNGVYRLDEGVRCCRAPTFWSRTGGSFLYLQRFRWSIAFREQLAQVQQGDGRGWACRVSPGLWAEWCDGAWVDTPVCEVPPCGQLLPKQQREARPQRRAHHAQSRLPAPAPGLHPFIGGGGAWAQGGDDLPAWERVQGATPRLGASTPWLAPSAGCGLIVIDSDDEGQAAPNAEPAFFDAARGAAGGLHASPLEAGSPRKRSRYSLASSV